MKSKKLPMVISTDESDPESKPISRFHQQENLDSSKADSINVIRNFSQCSPGKQPDQFSNSHLKHQTRPNLNYQNLDSSKANSIETIRNFSEATESKDQGGQKSSRFMVQQIIDDQDDDELDLEP
ncbi:hypothetical protein SS50377_22612 [Spironucleus salmonicida]|uniref:Uncharacterized protein n=1 Tax=Spironucleus salmonicida TaxID=348837 RepID=V6LCD2_9EUKA|nr:hypothetical protein SS50377_22612 [Spironucleus salmonicida]|eukprot:EST41898.1 Hypothetical protein SS50377_18201 [Spironucleus salmonicida]